MGFSGGLALTNEDILELLLDKKLASKSFLKRLGASIDLICDFDPKYEVPRIKNDLVTHLTVGHVRLKYGFYVVAVNVREGIRSTLGLVSHLNSSSSSAAIVKTLNYVYAELGNRNYIVEFIDDYMKIVVEQGKIAESLGHIEDLDIFQKNMAKSTIAVNNSPFLVVSKRQINILSKDESFFVGDQNLITRYKFQPHLPHNNVYLLESFNDDRRTEVL